MTLLITYLPSLLTNWVGVEEEPQDWSRERMAYQQKIRNEPPAMIRIKELGWKLPCGHTRWDWSDRIHGCLECARLGRTNPPDPHVAWFAALSAEERRQVIEAWQRAIEGRLRK